MRVWLNKGLSVAMVALMSVALSGCQSMQKAEQHNKDRTSESDDLLEIAKAPKPAIPADSVRSLDGVWLGARSFRAANGDALPTQLNNVTLVSAAALNLPQLAVELSRITKIPVVLEGDLGISGSAQGGQAPTPSGGDSTSLPGVTGGFGGGMDSGSAALDGTMRVNYSNGSLKGLMDLIATSFGVNWEYRDGEIRIFANETRVFTLFALPGTTDIGNSVTASGGQSGSSSGGGSDNQATAETQIGQSMVMTATIQFWEEIQAAVESMVPSGSVVALSPSTGTLTVSSPSWAMRRVEKYVASQNDRMSRQVAINVKVLQVRLNDGDTFGFQLDTVLQDFLTNGFTAASASVNPVTATGAGALSGVVVGGPNSAINDWAGSQAVISALSEVSNVSVVYNSSITTLNNRPAPVQAIRNISYISEVSQETTDTGTTVTVTPGAVTTGFTISLLPRVLADGNVMLHYSFNLVELLQEPIPTITFTGGTAIQLPETSQRAVDQEVMLKSGQTLVIAGYQQDGSNRTDRGTGSPLNFLLGGGKQGTNQKEQLVILLTPVVLDNPITYKTSGM